MPKQPGGISKSDRMQAVIDLLNRAGMLEKNEITQRIASVLNVEEEKIERALYRDLNELVDSGKLQVCSKDSLGKIVHPELDEIKNYKNFWFTDKHSPFEITGIGYLKTHGFNLISHHSLQKYIKCSIVNDFSADNAQIIIPTSESSIAISFEAEILPFEVFFCRKEDFTEEFKADFFAKFGKRSIFLQIPNIFFSRYQGDINKEMLSVYFEHDIQIKNPVERKIKYKKFNLKRPSFSINALTATGSITGLIDAESEFNSTVDRAIAIKNKQLTHVKVGDFDFILSRGRL